jgi:hypothetical protein
MTIKEHVVQKTCLSMLHLTLRNSDGLIFTSNEQVLWMWMNWNVEAQGERKMKSEEKNIQINFL